MAEEPTVAETAEEYLARQAHEWGQYVAVTPIYHHGVLCRQVGDPVPAENVIRHQYLEQGLVARVTPEGSTDAAPVTETQS